MSKIPVAIFTPAGISFQCAEISSAIPAVISTAPMKETMARNFPPPSSFKLEVLDDFPPLLLGDEAGVVKFLDVGVFHFVLRVELLLL